MIHSPIAQHREYSRVSIRSYSCSDEKARGCTEQAHATVNESEKSQKSNKGSEWESFIFTDSAEPIELNQLFILLDMCMW